MDRDRIESLHEAASEHYLRGEFREAVATWKSLLAIDPGHEEAAEGVRMAGMQCGDPAAAVSKADGHERRQRLDAVDAHLEAGDAAGAFALAQQLVRDRPGDEEAAQALERARSAQADAALDRGLSVLDSLSVGIDGARSDEPGSSGPPPDLDTAGVGSPALDLDLDAEPEPAPTKAAPLDEAESGLAVVPDSAGPAAAELKRRVQDLIDEAKRAASAERTDEALEILTRVFILDEENIQARALEDELRSVQGQASHDVDMWIAEGVQDFEEGRYDASREAFRRVLERYPEHAEAIDYLERIDVAAAARKTADDTHAPAAGHEPLRFDEDLLTGSPSARAGADSATAPGAPPEAAESIPLARRTEAPRAAAEPLPGETVVATAPAVAVTAPAVRRGPGRLVLGVVLVVLLAAAGSAAWFVPRLLSKPTPEAAPPPPAPVRRSKPAPKPAAPKPAAPRRGVADALAAAREAMAKGDAATAIVAYDEVLKQDPSNEEAQAGLRQAGDEYRVQKAEREQFDRAKTAFAEGEYTPALRLLYRMPKGRYDDGVEAGKFNAWFNLGIVSLKGGNCKDALASLDEALAIRPKDPDARRVKDLAVKFQNLARDRSYYDLVEAIPFRTFDQ